MYTTPKRAKLINTKAPHRADEAIKKSLNVVNTLPHSCCRSFFAY